MCVPATREKDKDNVLTLSLNKATIAGDNADAGYAPPTAEPSDYTEGGANPDLLPDTSNGPHNTYDPETDYGFGQDAESNPNTPSTPTSTTPTTPPSDDANKGNTPAPTSTPTTTTSKVTPKAAPLNPLVFGEEDDERALLRSKKKGKKSLRIDLAGNKSSANYVTNDLSIPMSGSSLLGNGRKS
jgi:hypothetical protein